MIRKGVKIVLEIFLEKLPSGAQNRISNLFNGLKSLASRWYASGSGMALLIRVCDFVIVRTNGDTFIEFELSNICNARCVFCPYPDMLKTEKEFTHMKEPVFQAVLDRMRHYNGKLVSFTPTTGDTLLHPDWDGFIGRVIALKGISRATMFTNAIELDDEASDRMIKLLKKDDKGKLSQIYFSVGGYDSATYKSLYQVDRFEKVKSNINLFLEKLINEKMTVGIHIHIKLLSGEKPDVNLAGNTYNSSGYKFLYFSHSSMYFSNDQYKRNALIDYYPDQDPEKKKACAYLKKTRFASDGGVWADGCVISEMPGDSSLKLGTIYDDSSVLELSRKKIIDNWEKNHELPVPCRGCTMYRS